MARWATLGGRGKNNRLRLQQARARSVIKSKQSRPSGRVQWWLLPLRGMLLRLLQPAVRAPLLCKWLILECAVLKMHYYRQSSRQMESGKVPIIIAGFVR